MTLTSAMWCPMTMAGGLKPYMDGFTARVAEAVAPLRGPASSAAEWLHVSEAGVEPKTLMDAAKQASRVAA
jgi:hypothetical protein